jgi:hypothetical protein
MTDASTPMTGNDRLSSLILRIDDLQRGLANVRTELLARVVPLEGRVLDLEEKFDKLLAIAGHTDSRLRFLEAKIIGGTGAVFLVVEAAVAIFHTFNK